MLAVAGGHVDAVSLLLEREANVNVANKHGLTALHLGVSATLKSLSASNDTFHTVQVYIVLLMMFITLFTETQEF